MARPITLVMTIKNSSSADWRNGLCGTLFFIASVGVLMLFTYNWYPILFPVYKGRLATPPDMNLTHIAGKLMEHVTINGITDNVYFTVRTSVENYRQRLSILLLTWFQTLDKNKVASYIAE